MGKTASIKSDLEDVESLVEIFSILKDVASNHFYNTAKRKERFIQFAEAFTEFFRMVSLSDADSPMVTPASENVGIVAVTSEGGFMGEMTAKVLRAAVVESEKHDQFEMMVIGYKGVQKMQGMIEQEFEKFTEIEEKGLYQVALEVKRYIIGQVEQKKIGRVFCVYPKAITANFIKPVVIKLLPSEELVSQQRGLKDVIEKVIVESDINEIIHYLAEVWLTCRLYEMLEDCVIAGFAAQALQLEASLEKLKGDQKGLAAGFKKAKKSDIDKSLREVFTAKTMTQGARR